MTLDFLSKYGIIVGVVSMLAGCMSTLSTIYYICLMYFTDEGEKFGDPVTAATGIFLVFVISLIISMVSCLMIFGIIKKRHVYLTPWLVVAFLISLYISGISIYDAVRISMFHFDLYIAIILVVGGSVIVLYPLCHLTLNIRRHNDIRRLTDFKSNYEHNILSNCAMGSDKSTQGV